MMTLKNKLVNLFVLFMPFFFCNVSMAGMKVPPYAYGIDALINKSVLAINVIVAKIEDTDIVRDLDYLEYDDYGSLIKSKERKMLVHCDIKSIGKNETGVNFAKERKITATFWEEIKGPTSKLSKEDWQRLPKVGESLLLIFLKDSIKTTETGTEYQPTCVINNNQKHLYGWEAEPIKTQFKQL